jgi:ferritin
VGLQIHITTLGVDETEGLLRFFIERKNSNKKSIMRFINFIKQAAAAINKKGIHVVVDAVVEGWCNKI